MAITSYKAVVGYYNGAGTPNITTAVTGQLSDGWIPIGAPILTDAYGQCTQMMAKTDATPVIATSAYTVVTAANPQPPDATWDAQGEPLWIDTATYLQAYTKGGAYLQGTVPVSRGGTGATTTLAAAANLRVFAIPNNLSEITDRSAAWLNVRPTGPLPLGGDPVNDYDATTMRWVKNYVDAGGGGGGASMNGVMNYGVGQITLWHSRAFIPSYAVVADGQLLSRTAYPELWAHAQTHGPVTDAVWLAGTNNRAKFSTGDGSTTFRVPDLNGVQTGSIKGLYGKGDGGNSGTDATVIQSSAPNVTGYFQNTLGLATFENVSGAFYGSDAAPYAQYTSSGSSSTYPTRINLDMSRSSGVYGRNSATTINTDAFVGVWIIRANGGFTAANTQWQVINADAAAPSTGVTVNGGKVESQYKNPASTQYARLYSSSLWGSPNGAVIESQGADIHQFKFFENGNMDFRKSGHGNALGMHSVASSWTPLINASVTDLTTGGVDRVLEATASDSVLLGYSLGAARPNGYPTKVGFHQYVPGSPAFGSAVITIGGDNNKWARYLFDITGQLSGSTNDGAFSYTRNGVSDSRVKHDIAPTTVDKAWQNLKALQFVTFIYNNDEQSRTRRGLIAQQAETVDSLYVKTRMYPGENIGDPMVEQKELDNTPLLLDTMHVVQKLIAEIEALKAEVAFLKSGK